MAKKYDIFICHAWEYNSEYYRLTEMLNSVDYFYWRNYSVPEHDPLIDPETHVGYNKLKKEIEKQIRPVNCVLIISGIYIAYRDWLQTELELSLGYDKPIVGIRPWGSVNTPTAVQNAAVEIVGWNTNSIVAAIREHSL